MNKMEEILNKSKEYFINVKEQQSANNENEKKNYIEKINDCSIKNVDYKTDCYSTELLNLINMYNFKIISYEKYENKYSKILEKYCVHINNWCFSINNIVDFDIKEGIFMVSNLENIVTGEKINKFSCDLGCRYTKDTKLNALLKLLSFNSEEEYLKHEYNDYFLLPELLIKKGYNVYIIKNDLKFNNVQICLQLHVNIFVVIYEGVFNDVKLVVTNYKNWSSSLGNYSISSSLKRKAYYFDNYKKENIDELCKCIEAFKDEQNNEIGYFENNRYYNNKDLINFFESIKNEQNEHYFYKNEIDYVFEDYWDGRGYSENESVVVNKYKGLEIYLNIELNINFFMNYNKSFIIFKYDKREDHNNCKLQIFNYYDSKLRNNNNDSNYEYNEIIRNYVNKNTLNIFENSGTFNEMLSELKKYIYDLCSNHNINL